MAQNNLPRTPKLAAACGPHLYFAALLVAAAATVTALGVTHVTPDFFKAYYPAARAAATGAPLTHTYYRYNTYDGDGFKSPPIVAAALIPFGGDDFAQAESRFKVQEVAAYVLAFCLLGLRFGGTRRRTWLLAALFVFSWPFFVSVHLGQLTPLTLLVVAGLLWSWLDGQRAIAGICLALGILLKIPIAVLVLFFAVKREWRLLMSAAIALTAATVAGVILFGWATHVDYWHMVIGKNESGAMLAFNNQSLHAFVARFLYPPALLDWNVAPIPPGLRLALGAVSAAILAAASWKAWRPHVADDVGRSVQFCAFLVASLLIMPVSWDHYYLLLIIPTFLLVSESTGGATMAAIALSWLLINLPIYFVGSVPKTLMSFIEQHPASIVFISAHFVGGVLMFLLLMSFRASTKSLSAQAE
jgi:hypothetical protein